MKFLVAACAGLVFAACAFADDPQWVTDPSTPLERNGFVLLPPAGRGWMVGPSGPYGARFAKPIVAADGSRSVLTVQVSAGRFKDRQFDLRTEQGLREAAQYTATGGDPRRFKVIEANYSAVFQDQGTDCIRYQAVQEEYDNPLAWNKGQVLVASFHGVLCRHPHSPDYAVTTLFSERHPRGDPSQLDDRLREEAQHSLRSVRFAPLKP